ncbi:MAG: c-type cytochrome [Myxococcales bacterium]|nr:c-type cytochrome [Myxococcales bacterium]
MLLILLGSVASACDPQDQGPDTIPDDIFAPLGEPRPSATEEQIASFERGRQILQHRFTASEGLGPNFNNTFCGGCHEKPVFGGGAGRYRDFLIVGQGLSDGSFTRTGINGVQTQYQLEPPARVPSDPETNLSAVRNPIPFFGIGLLAEIPEKEILRRADPDDKDGDGISGRPNYDRGFVGRFGRKSQTVSLEGFIRGPLFNHLGITSEPLSEELKRALPVPSPSAVRNATKQSASEDASKRVAVVHLAQAAAPEEPTEDSDGVADPELDEDSLFDLISFVMLLAAPQPAAPGAASERGGELFAELGCDGCHVPTLRGPRGLIPAYSDLLLHDMGDELADGIPMGDATGREFRTQPLWGARAAGPYLHDGRADTLEQAIELHGGEAEASRDAFVALDDNDRRALLAMIEALGGDYEPIGAGAPLPEAGEPGAPIAGLSADERARFDRGRKLFDRDFAIGAGLGPRFNGDSCRACHFEPVIGGAGPAGVDVTRQGLHDPVSGDFSAPEMGTMAHRHQLGHERAPVDPDANVSELRQTPPVFGLGLIDRIDEAAIRALADPEDADGDGIAGRVHELPDGRLGRLGWKASVPSTAEFVRDASSNELGLTLPAQAGHSFGFGADDDGADDPELSADELSDLIFFVEKLAPLVPVSKDAAAEAEGAEVFEMVGCAGCHVPSLPAVDGSEVPLYSDLLLHDVQPEGFVGIADGQAGMGDFRTPPLWGLGRSAPYMHDGRAFSVEQSIERHAAEGAASRDAYQALDAEARAALIAFLESL